MVRHADLIRPSARCRCSAARHLDQRHGRFGGAVNMTTESLTTEFSGEASLSTVLQHQQAGRRHLVWLMDGTGPSSTPDAYRLERLHRPRFDRSEIYCSKAATTTAARWSSPLVRRQGQDLSHLQRVTEKDMERYGALSRQRSVFHLGGRTYGDGSHVDYYDDQTDNYLQITTRSSSNHRFNDRWASTPGFYTYGYGIQAIQDDAW